MSWLRRLLPWLVGLSLGCTGTMDAGGDLPRGLLPVDARNPIVLCNDGARDNWQGELALLFSRFGGPKLTGIVVNDSPAWTELAENLAGWEEMTAAARQSGFDDVPSPVASRSTFKIRPDDGLIESTAVQDSEGARFIVDAVRLHATADRPLVIVTGGRLTEVADAFLLEPTIAEQVVVVAALGTLTDTGALMDRPNGEMDHWANIIVSSRLRYIQVSQYYNQKEDVPEARLSELPDTAFGRWIAAKQATVLEESLAADQISVLAVAEPEFVTEIMFAQQVNQSGGTLTLPPALEATEEGEVRVVTGVNADLPRELFWDMLKRTE